MSTYNDALYTNSTLALNPRTGQVAWYFQHVPGETLDLDIVFERVLVDVDDHKWAAVEPGRNVGVEVERTRDARAAFRRCPPSQRSCRGAPPRMCSWFRGRIAAARATSWRKAA